MGRKKLKDPRKSGYRLRLNAEEEEMLESICKETGVKKSVLFRQFINEQYKDKVLKSSHCSMIF